MMCTGIKRSGLPRLPLHSALNVIEGTEGLPQETWDSIPQEADGDKREYNQWLC